MMKAIGVLVSLMLLATGAQAQSAKEKYELIERCAKQAAEVFAKEWGAGSVKDHEYELRGRYENHYSSRFNKCFYLEIDTTSTNKTLTKRMTLWDLNDNKHYGSYAKDDPHTLSSLPDPVECWTLQEKQCKSEEEWRSLIKPFMED